MQSYHKELLDNINTRYEGIKTEIDNHFKILIQTKREDLSRIQLNLRENQDEESHAHKIAQAFTAITDEHAKMLKRLR